MFNKFLKYPLFFFVLGLASFNASAWTWNGTASIKSIEATNLPASLNFAPVTVVTAECPSNALVWAARGSTDAAKVDNAKAILAVLLTSITSDMNLIMYGTGCNVEFIYVSK